MKKVNMVTLEESALPDRITSVIPPPKQLYIQGPLKSFLQAPCIAIVGSRRVSPYGRAVTLRLAQELAERGIVIVSGLAIGVDSLAHQAALDAGGRTIAILPTALSSIYPRSHTHLAQSILQAGNVLVSEYADDTPPMKHQFIARNRLIAGLADAVLIPEAAEKSGSLHTAAFALEQGKTILAVPGNITSELSRGTNNLVKTGAIPVTAVSDIFYALGIEPTLRQLRLPADETESIILDLLQQGTTDMTQLQIQSGLDPALFNQTLTMLELAGKIRSVGAGHWATT
ncbi:MAG TPA: DNA-processing protein DprA [Verrucomicrobiae bacterium]|nr:DNA-processing protein DprA [Verrucomicrobiae bacterium]